MAFAERADNDGLLYITCPFPNDDGCDCMAVIRGYCVAGLQCVRNCEHAWTSRKDDA